MRRFYRILLWVQGSYTLITALWGLVDIESFMKVTGPKTDIWLVKTVSAVLAAIGITFISFAREKTPTLTALVMGISVSVAVAFIDFFYTANEVISWVYALDGLAETAFLVGWLIIALNWRRAMAR